MLKFHLFLNLRSPPFWGIAHLIFSASDKCLCHPSSVRLGISSNGFDGQLGGELKTHIGGFDGSDQPKRVAATNRNMPFDQQEIGLIISKERKVLSMKSWVVSHWAKQLRHLQAKLFAGETEVNHYKPHLFLSSEKLLASPNPAPKGLTMSHRSSWKLWVRTSSSLIDIHRSSSTISTHETKHLGMIHHGVSHATVVLYAQGSTNPGLTLSYFPPHIPNAVGYNPPLFLNHYSSSQ